ncbi:hypothetical protein GCM10009836_05780 [Pseudonocardia ailaonensis]|uniref:MarR family transcriptional regulator n=1 Tax=Pseudonocardia ailaonensis TaxID=367279 RepID=A0ABN2MLD8_9PSEU
MDDIADVAPERTAAAPADGPREPDEEQLWAVVRALAEPVHRERLNL